MSKYFTVITVGYIMLCILFVVMIPITGLMLGFDGFSTPYIYVSGGEVKGNAYTALCGRAISDEER